MLGQTNRGILAAELQRKLRRNSTLPELKLWLHLRAKRLGGFKFRRQHPFGDFILDFYCAERRVVVELDGSQHLDSNSDAVRDAVLAEAGLRVVRFWNHDVLDRTPQVLEAILDALRGAREA